MSAQPPRRDLSDIREELDQALGATGPLTAREHAEQLTVIMLRALDEVLDRERLGQLVVREHLEDAYAAAREFASCPPERRITNRVLQEARDRWQARRRQQAADPVRPKRGRAQ